MPTETRAPDIQGLMELQRDMVVNGRYEILGRVKCIVIDPEAQGNMPGKAIADAVGRRLDFYGSWPVIAQSIHHSQLLLVGHQWGPAFLRRDGTVGLPDIPDLSWRRPAPTKAEIQDPNYEPPQAPMIRQSLSDRARAVLPSNGTRYIVCGPVSQILVKPDALPMGLLVHAFAGGAEGKHMELLVDQTSGDGFLLFGRYEIRRAG